MINDDIKKFHETSRFVKAVYCAFLVLILKKVPAEEFKDCRPSNLVGNIYKLLSETHHTFVCGGQILDAALVANEAIHSARRNGIGAIVCKLDINKVYGHFN